MKNFFSASNSEIIWKVIVFNLISIFFQSIGIKWFIKSSHLAANGMGGVGLGITYIFEKIHIHIAFGTMYLLLNIPLLILSWFKINKKFTILTIFNVVGFSLFSDFIPTFNLSNDVLVNSIVGASCLSLGLISALSVGSSQGGVDILGVYFAKKDKGSVGVIGMYVTLVAFALTAYTSSFTILVYSFISQLVVTLLTDKFYEQSAKETLLIVSEDLKPISDKITKKIHRGTTSWKGKGGYTNKDKEILFVTISSDQKAIVKNIVKKVDPKAFVVTLKTESTLGEWTNRIGERSYTRKEIDFIDD